MTFFVSVAQMNSQDDIEQNFATVENLIQRACLEGASLLVLPENFICFAPNRQIQTAQRFEEIQQRLEKLAHVYQIWLIAGTLPCLFRPNGEKVTHGRVRTVSLCISPEKTEARYDKIHLFDVKVNDAVGGYQESQFFEPGRDIVNVKTPFGILGLTVCYDLRFPELAIRLRQQGANILTAPAAFTYATGQKHWQLLLQARALDTQCYVLGATQQGWHGKLRQTWGHAGIIDSNGQVLKIIDEEGSSLITQPLDLDEQQLIRQSMPLIKHRYLI